MSDTCLSDIAKQIVEIDKEKGWNLSVLSPPEMHMRIVMEIAEATESWRNNEKEIWYDNTKPSGEAYELVDAIILILGYFGWKGWNIDRLLKFKMQYNTNRPYRHGGKKF